MIRSFAASAALLVVAPVSEACTDFRISADDGTVLVGRSMEFGEQLESNLRSSPRGRAFATTTSNNKPGLSWKGKYGYLYLDGFKIDAAFDGMNEKGLSFGYLYFPGEASYQTIPEGKDASVIPYYQFGDWVLSNFQNVDEVKEALKNIYISSKQIPQLGKVVLPAHASIYDSTGKGIIVECYDNKINVTDSLGVLTNSPKYDWQITNLRNYLNLSPMSPDPITRDGMTFMATGQGSGSFGLPGDASPPSRFVKTAFMAKNVYKAKNQQELVNLAEHMLNNVDLPAGLVRAEYKGSISTDTTQWVVFKDLTHKVLLYRTYNNMTLRAVEMNKVDFSEKAPLLKMPLISSPYVVNVTDKFQGSTASDDKKQ